MGAVEDLRKVLQDVVTPDFKALEERVASLEKRLDGRIDALDKKMDSKFAALDQKIDLKHENLVLQIQSLADLIKHTMDIDRRLERI